MGYATLVTSTVRSTFHGSTKTVKKKTSNHRSTVTHSPAATTSSFSLKVVSSTWVVPPVTLVSSCPTLSLTKYWHRSNFGPTTTNTANTKRDKFTCCLRTLMNKSALHLDHIGVKLTKLSKEQS